ncbi:MAG: hypothetical protein GXP40_12825 [Chloroflexi bacterium]|nr:hypothetical protein [Chloroflexota bacterium]
MLAAHHRNILVQALGDTFGPRALGVVVRANLRQDNLRGQIGHDEYHFDNNAFAESRAYIETNRAIIRPALESGHIEKAWAAFGRLTHTAQDFYAHSNYITMWLSRFDGRTPPAPPEVDPLDPELLASPGLRSGVLYYPLELLSYVPALKRFILPLIPRDSHAWMNLDSPEQGPKFDYAFEAAVKRTRHEFEQVAARLSPQQTTALTGK